MATRINKLLLGTAILSLAFFGRTDALQGGPVMPEYVQFEPADAPDVVNLNTGDFSYSVPLGDVPGPYGGYPLTLSYHAGIGPNQEATWVGLGWTLNPGAINRNLRGTPDDQFNGGELSFIYAYSVTTAYSVGVSLPLGPVGLNMSYDSFSGYGMMASIEIPLGQSGWSLGVAFGSGGVGVDIGTVGRNGGPGLSGGIMFGESGVAVTGDVGFKSPSTNGATIGASLGVHSSYGGKVSAIAGFGVTGKSGVGMQIGSDGRVTASYSKEKKPDGVGASSSGNSPAKRKTLISGSVNLSSKSHGVSVSVAGTGLAVSSASSSSSSSSANSASFQIPILFSYSRSVYESWIRQGSSQYSYGYMYQAGPGVIVDGQAGDVVPPSGGGTGGGGAGGPVPWNFSFKGQLLDHLGNPSKGHLYPGYDVFAVSAQGMSGSFRALPMTDHELLMSVEHLEGDQASPNSLNYLLKEQADSEVSNPLLKRQVTYDFPDLVAAKDNGTLADLITKYAYDYCADNGNVRYAAEWSAQTKLESVEDGECSRYSFFRSTHLNEGNRLVLAGDGEERVDLSKRFRSRLEFVFMGEAGGFYESEPAEHATEKYERDQSFEAMIRKTTKDWRHEDWGTPGATGDWEDPLLSIRRIEPILEGSSNMGRLAGFKITNPDGTEYRFEQPVYSVMSGSYTTSQKTSGPVFIDRKSDAADDDWTTLVAEGWREFNKAPLSSLGGALKGFGDLLVGGVSSFLFYSPKFTTACETEDNPDTESYNYSYQLSTNPYATQWLLTEIRGPDFVELGTREELADNYGYQVRFNYHDPIYYNWRTPYSRPGAQNSDVVNQRLPKNGLTPIGCRNSELYHGSFGVKQLVYLESIETATHKAVFDLNNPMDVNEQRFDGKGWIYDWEPEKGTTEGDEGLPVVVGVNALWQIEELDDDASPTPREIQTDITASECEPTENNPCPEATLKFNEKPAKMRLKHLYFDSNPLRDQIQAVVNENKELVYTGLFASGTQAAVLNKKDKSFDDHESAFQVRKEPLEPVPDDPTKDKDRIGTVPLGIVTPHQHRLAAEGQQRYFKNHVQSIERTEGAEARLGAYKITFQNPPLIEARYRTSPSCEMGGFDCAEDEFWERSLKEITVSEFKKGDEVVIGPATGDIRNPRMQLLLYYNPFFNFFKDDPAANQMRKLEKVDIYDKRNIVMSGDELDAENSSPFRRFKFGYNYELHPLTLNSYKVRDFDGNPGFSYSDHKQSYAEINHQGGNSTTPGEGLRGRLTLKSVTEQACAGLNCLDHQSLPPFRFSYQSPTLTAFEPDPQGSMEETIRLTGARQDVWGYLHKRATLENNKTGQYEASDNWGAAWSLNKIVDPNGGTMAIHYERDTYHGENYQADDLAIPVAWTECNPEDGSSEKVLCLDFVPRKWVEYCDRNDLLQGEYQHVFDTEDPEFNLDYMKKKGFVEGTEVFFNVQQVVQTEVGCGFNVGFWKSHGCDRHRSVSIVGKAKIENIDAEINDTKPVFDRMAYTADGCPGGDNCKEMQSCEGATCCSDQNTTDEKLGFSGYYWRCGYVVTRAKTNLPYETVLKRQIGVTADKLRERDWEVSDPSERIGVVWARKPNSEIRGGDLRVKKLVKRDIGLEQTTVFDYGTGEMAKYPDSAFSSTFASRFSTAKITNVINSDDINDNDPNTPEIDVSEFHNFPAMSRIPGITDDEAILLPSSKISYSQVTVRNVVSGKDGSIDQAHPNGKIEYRYHGPERKGLLDIVIQVEEGNMSNPLNRPQPLYVTYFRMRDGVEEKLPIVMARPSGTPGNGEFEPPWTYQATYLDLEGVDTKAIEISRIEFRLGDMDGPAHDSYVLPADVANRGPVSRLEIQGALDPDFRILVAPAFPSYVVGAYPRDFEILEKESPAQNSTVFRDRTSWIGRSITTTYFRNMGEANNPDYKMVKQDSMIYGDKPSSIDTRFIGTRFSQAQLQQKMGRQIENWSYHRKVKCEEVDNDPLVPDCKFTDNTSQWKQYQSFHSSAREEVQHVRMSPFILRTVSKSGFNGSTGPQDLLVTETRNFQYDPLTGEPSVTIAYSGFESEGLNGTASKVTRTTPAYLVDPDQVTTDLPMFMFTRNMVEQKFREDVFTFDDGTVWSGTGAVVDFSDPGIYEGSQADNGGALASNLTDVKITPFSQMLYSHATGELPALGGSDIGDPLMPLGSFTNRFDPVTESSLSSKNRTIFKSQPDLTLWQGVRISRVNRLKKPIVTEDAYGRKIVHRYEPTGFHEIGLFGPTDLEETAVLTPEGYENGAPAEWNWSFPAGTPTVSNDFLEFSSHQEAVHPFRLDPEQEYVVELQVHCSEDVVVELLLESQAQGYSAAKTLTLKPGLNAYSVVLTPQTSSAIGDNFRLKLPSLENVSLGLRYLRIYEVDAEAKTFVFNQRGELIQSVDESNLSSYYEYDLFGNLINIRNDDGVMFSAHKRIYGNRVSTN